MSIANIRQFHTWLDRQARVEIPEAGRDLSLRVARLAIVRIIEATPFKTGLARGNWKVSINQPDTRVEQTLDPTGQIAIHRAEQALSLALLGDQIFIQNNLEYIEALEHGHSQQAPFGMIQVTLAELQHFGLE